MAAAARRDGDQVLLSRSLALLGRARRSLGEIDLAERDLREAVAAGESVGDDELVADAHLALAGVLSFSGRSQESKVHLDIVDRRGSDAQRTYAALQRAAVDQRMGRLREALATYDALLPTLRTAAARVDTALVLMNSGLIRTETGGTRRAIEDLRSARAIFAEEGHRFGAAQTWHNLGCAYAARGDLPGAMHHFDSAAEQFAALGHAAPELDVDRIETLIAAGLLHDAADLASTVADTLHAAGDHSHGAMVWLLRARIALLFDDRQASGHFADHAAALFQQQGAVAWHFVARLQGFMARDGHPDELTELGVALDSAMNARGAATAFGLASVAATRIGDTDRARLLADGCAARARRVGVLEVALLVAYARAVLEAQEGNPRGALRHARQGLRVLEDRRATLVASDARAAIAAHSRQLVTVGLEVAAGTGSTATLLEWVERGRVSAALASPAHPLHDEDLTEGLGELRALSGAIRAGEAQGTDHGALLVELRRRERALHRRMVRQSPTAGPGRESGRATGAWRPPPMTTVRQCAGGTSLAALCVVGDRLLAVRVGRRHARRVDLAAAADVVSIVRSVESSLRLANTPGRPPAAADVAITLLRRGLTALDGTVGPVLSGDGAVSLVVPEWLHAVPWHLLPSVVGRPVTVAPSVSWWTAARAAGSTASGRDCGPAVAVAGPRLRHARAEAVAAAARYPGGRALVDGHATVDAVTHALATAGVLHIACHGRFRRDNPLWSALELTDGPLFGYDLQRLPRVPPTVVLSGCETGTGAQTGDRLLGLAPILLERGARAVLASLGIVGDTVTTRDTMSALHARVAAGCSPAEALAELDRDADDETFPVLAALGCFGVAT